MQNGGTFGAASTVGWGVCGDYNANFSIVGMVVLLQGGGPPLKPPTETEMPFIFNAFDTCRPACLYIQTIAPDFI